MVMYDDHLEIVSPARFYFGIEPAKLAVPHESKPWNSITAIVIYRAGIIERWGMATLTILALATPSVSATTWVPRRSSSPFSV